MLHLASVRMLGAGVDAQLSVQRTTQRRVGQHTPDRPLDHTRWSLGQLIFEHDSPQAAGIAGVAIVDLLVGLASTQADFGCVDHDDVIAQVHVGCIGRVVLAPQELSHLASEATERHA